MCKNQEKLSKKFIFFEKLLNKCVFGSFVFTVWYFLFPVLYYPAKNNIIIIRSKIYGES